MDTMAASAVAYLADSVHICADWGLTEPSSNKDDVVSWVIEHLPGTSSG